MSGADRGLAIMNVGNEPSIAAQIATMERRLGWSDDVGGKDCEQSRVGRAIIATLRAHEALKAERSALANRVKALESGLRDIASESTGYAGGLNAAECRSKARALLAKSKPCETCGGKREIEGPPYADGRTDMEPCPDCAKETSK